MRILEYWKIFKPFSEMKKMLDHEYSKYSGAVHWNQFTLFTMDLNYPRDINLILTDFLLCIDFAIVSNLNTINYLVPKKTIHETVVETSNTRTYELLILFGIKNIKIFLSSQTDDNILLVTLSQNPVLCITNSRF